MKIKNISLIILAISFSLFYSCKDDEKDTSNGNDEKSVEVEVVYDDDNEYYNNDNFTHFKQKRSVKRGSAYGFDEPFNEFDVKQLKDGISWFYNWGNSVSNQNVIDACLKYDIPYIPMCWNNNYSAATIKKTFETFPNNEYLLGYNEPNLTDQANMLPKDAAAKWGNVVKLAKENGKKLVSPALNFGQLAGYSQPWDWFDDFLACDGVNKEDMCALALHCYRPSPSAVLGFIHDPQIEKYNMPIWLTEYCSEDGGKFLSIAQQKTMMCQTLNFFEADDMVERYSWFMPRASGSWATVSLLGEEDINYKLTELGKMYVYGSSQDKSKWANVTNIIEAENFSSCNAVDGLRERNYAMPTVTYNATKDSKYSKGMLDIQFKTGMWTEYQINDKEGGERTLLLRSKAVVASSVKVIVNDKNTFNTTLTLDDDWHTAGIPIRLDKGHNTVRIVLEKGNVYVNWLTIQ